MSTSSTAATVSPIAEAPAAVVVAREKKGKRRLVFVALAFLLALGGYFGYRAFVGNDQSTDDAVVDADVVPVSLRVGGKVVAVSVADNAVVKKGQVLLELDKAELDAKVRQAEGELAAAQAQASAADAQVSVAEAGARGGLSTAKAQVSTSRAQAGTAVAQVAAAQAQLTRAQVDEKKSKTDLDRMRSLREQDAVTQQQLEAAQAANEGAQAALAAARAQLAATEEMSQVARSRVAEASGQLDTSAPIDAKIAAARANADLSRAKVVSAQASLDLARLALAHATVVAPSDGVVSHLASHVGQVVNVGQLVASIVPLDTYVVANFKETQVGGISAGQHVDIDVDSYPGQEFHGVVDSVARGTGSRFSMLAPDNAAGNFVKVVQRVSVRIRWDALPAGVVLRPGQSVEVTVHTRG